MAFSHTDALARLTEAHAADRLAHAYLLVGARGSGKNEILRQLSARILGVPPAGAFDHPDFHLAEPESKSRRILIEPIRRLERAIRSGATAGGAKIAVIREADRLQPQAANAFLKTLEEPPSGSHVFLTSSVPGALLDTIVSRCIVVSLRAGVPTEPTPAELDLLDALETIVRNPTSPVGDGFGLARTLLDLLNAERETIRDEFLTAYKDDQKHYKNTTDGAWLDEREDQIKALTEAAALRRRADLLQTVTNWFTDALRIQHQAPPIAARPAQHAAAANLSTRSLLRRIRALETMTSDLNSSVYEQVAVEAGFLRVFSAES
jgi:DNA polymerase-3 subunit delta'